MHQVELRTAVGPAAEFQLTLLDVVWVPLDVNCAERMVHHWWFPCLKRRHATFWNPRRHRHISYHPAIVVDLRLRDDRHPWAAMCAKEGIKARRDFAQEFLLVVEDDVRQPDHFARQVEMPHSAVFFWIPRESVVVPVLQGIKLYSSCFWQQDALLEHIS